MPGSGNGTDKTFMPVKTCRIGRVAKNENLQKKCSPKAAFSQTNNKTTYEIFSVTSRDISKIFCFN